MNLFRMIARKRKRQWLLNHTKTVRLSLSRYHTETLTFNIERNSSCPGLIDIRWRRGGLFSQFSQFSQTGDC